MRRRSRRASRTTHITNSTNDIQEPLKKARRTTHKPSSRSYSADSLENVVPGKKKKKSLCNSVSPSSDASRRMQKISKTLQIPTPHSRSSSRNSSATNLSPKKNTVKEMNVSPTTSLLGKHAKEITQKVNYLYSSDLCCPPISPLSSPNLSGFSRKTKSKSMQQTNIEEINTDDERVLMFLVCENCWYILVSTFQNHVTKNSYLTPVLLRSIFYGITVERKDRICLSLVEVFKAHLKLFPPSRKDLKKLYHVILFGNIKIDAYKDSNIVKYSLRNIINTIEEIVKKVLNDESKNQGTFQVEAEEMLNLENSSLDEILDYINKRYIKTGNLLSLPAFNYNKDIYANKDGIDNKTLLHRLFLIFGLALDILEENFQMWWAKSYHKLQDRVNSQRSCPYIAEAGWGKDEKKGCINERCVQIFMLFTICPPEYKHHLSRYIALCFRVAQANEENTEMKFPYFHNLCYSFATEFAQHVRGTNELTENTVNTIQFIYPMWLRFKVCGFLLSSEITSNGQDGLQSAFKVLVRNLVKKKCNTSSALSYNLSLQATKANAINSEGETALHKYCRRNSCIPSARKLLKYPGMNVNIKDNYGWTPLHNTALYNSVDCLNLLISHRLPPSAGAEALDIFVLNSNNDSPLICAVKNRHLEIIDILLENGAGTTIWNKNKDGHSAMDLAPDDLRKKLRESWQSSIGSFQHLRMSQIEVSILNLMIFAYCTEYHINEKVDPSDSKSAKSDAVYKYNYTLYYKDCKTFERLLLIVNKLCLVPTNPKNLHILKNFLNSYR